MNNTCGWFYHQMNKTTTILHNKHFFCQIQYKAPFQGLGHHPQLSQAHKSSWHGTITQHRLLFIVLYKLRVYCRNLGFLSFGENKYV